jgi:hypothetical protein
MGYPGQGSSQPHFGRLRNEANSRRNGFVWNGLEDGWRVGFEGLAGVPEAFELVKRILVGALSLVDAALEAGKGRIGDLEGVAAGYGSSSLISVIYSSVISHQSSAGAACAACPAYDGNRRVGLQKAVLWQVIGRTEAISAAGS